MSTQKDCIEKLENDVQDIKESVQRMAQGSEVQMQQMDRKLKEMMDRAVKDMQELAKSVGEHSRHGGKDKDVGSTFNTGGYRDYRDDGQHKRHLEMDFPYFSGNDPTEWLNQANQFFAYQQTLKEQKVSLATFYLEGPANQWWQWLTPCLSLGNFSYPSCWHVLDLRLMRILMKRCPELLKRIPFRSIKQSSKG
jgi:hypothetical protein